MAYAVVDGVVRLTSGPSHAAPHGIASRLLENGRLYDWLQHILGYREAARRLQSVLGDTSQQLVLDVGGGTGNLYPFLSPGTRYVCLDNDAGKIQRLRQVRPDIAAVVGDATQLPFGDRSIDVAVCVAVTHHLDGEALERLVAELARVVRERVVVFDPLREQQSRRGRLLWRINRGSYPRSEQELVSMLNRGLTSQHVERFAIHHHYLLWAGRPAAVTPNPASGEAGRAS